MYKYLLCWRYLKTRYIALASVISVMLGVATMIVVNSVMAGFAHTMRDRLHGILADVVVESYDLKTQIPVNLMKEGGEPVYKPDAEYPPWVWQLLEEPPLPEDLLIMGVEHMSAKEMKYVKRAANKDRLATNNENSEKTKASMD